MADDQPAPMPPEDELSKEFDEIIAQTEAQPGDQSDGAVVVDVRRDTTPLDMPSAPVPQASSQPVVSTPPVAASTPARSSGGTMVLQWLSYAFWGWFGVAMGWLSAVTIAYFVSGNSSDITSALAYPLASVIVMYLLAVAADLVYARREPAHKQGGANAIMLVHVVLFILIAVGSAVTALFALISMMLNTDPSVGTNGQVVAAWTSLILVVIFAMIAARALFGGRKSKLRLAHWGAMSALALGMIIVTIVGPVVGAQVTKDDRLIEEGLPQLNQAINGYAEDKGKLPATLTEAADLSTWGTPASESLAKSNLVRYTPNVKAATFDDTYYSKTSPDGLSFSKTFYYRLCVTYKQARKGNGTYYDSSATGAGNYKSYLTIYAHAKGEVCYDLKTSSYGSILYDDATVGTSAKQ